MIYRCFAVYDSKSEAFNPPWHFHAVGQCLRAFMDLANDMSTMIGKYPTDFILFEVGTWDDHTARYESYATPVNLGSASQFLSPKPDAPLFRKNGAEAQENI